MRLTLLLIVSLPLLAVLLPWFGLLVPAHVAVVLRLASLPALLLPLFDVFGGGEGTAHVEAYVRRDLLAVVLLTLAELILGVARELLDGEDVELVPAMGGGVLEEASVLSLLGVEFLAVIVETLPER